MNEWKERRKKKKVILFLRSASAKYWLGFHGISGLNFYCPKEKLKYKDSVKNLS